MPNIVEVQQALSLKICELDAVVKDVHRLINDMHDVVGVAPGINTPTEHLVGRTQFVGMPAGVAIQSYINIKGGPATQGELCEVLPAGGFDTGKYPKRTIANGVSFGVKNKRLERKNGLVYVRTG